MPQFIYRGRDNDGKLRVGQRTSFDANILSAELIKEGITPVQIKPYEPSRNWLSVILDFIHGKNLHREELAIFSRQMQLLHQAGVPIVEALKQLAGLSKLRSFSEALNSVSDFLEKGESLSTALRHFPHIFPPLMVNIVQIGEDTGHLSDSFGYIFQYLEFEINNAKQFKAAFRYPLFVLSSIIFAFLILNLFVIPTFARSYANLQFSLPWQTRLLIATSNFFSNFKYYLLFIVIAGSILFFRYIKTPTGKYRWNKFLLHIPVIGKLFKRIILIRFCQIFAIILKSGLPLNQGLSMVKSTIANTYIVRQIEETEVAIESGTPFTQAITKIELFSPLELQILAVGERSGELSPALSYIANFHTQEIEFDLKRMNDMVGPVLLGAVSVLVLILALGIYLPIWNMINLVH